jgi:tetraacyldisaccharide 4'-kinase
VATHILSKADLMPRASPLPAALRWAGPVLAAGFGAAVALRRWCYRTGLRRVRRAPVPVLGVGNLTAGGTGKTPAVACLARGLLARGRRPAIVLRGYGARTPGELNDEGRELARALPGVPVLANPDRHAGARAAAARGYDVVLLDDGFQHWRLARDLDLVLVDAKDPFSGGRLLPWGYLREKPEALARAGAVLITRSDSAPPEALAALRAELARLAPKACLGLARHAPTQLRRLFTGAPLEPARNLARRRVLAACALAQPAAFHETLVGLNAEVTIGWTYPDHHAYTKGELDEWLTQAGRVSAAGVVVTEKDAAKLETLPPPPPDAPPVWALRIEFQITEGEAALWARIEESLR